MTTESSSASMTEELAREYAIASIIYYGGSGKCTGMSDANFDGICDWLLKGQAWNVVPWLEREMLKAGSGYDLSRYPEELHVEAGVRISRPCPCTRCMADRGEIKDPDVLRRLGKRVEA